MIRNKGKLVVGPVLAIATFSGLYKFYLSDKKKLNDSLLESLISMQAEAGSSSSMVLQGGAVYGCGSRKNGLLGHSSIPGEYQEDNVNVKSFTRQYFEDENGNQISPRFQEIALASNHAVALDYFGNLWHWGSRINQNHFEKGEIAEKDASKSDLEKNSIRLFGSLKGLSIDQIACNNEHIFALNSRNNLLYFIPSDLKDVRERLEDVKVAGATTEKPSFMQSVWRYFSETSKDTFEPFRVNLDGCLESGEKITKISLGAHHAVALSSKGNVFTARLSDVGNFYGQLGRGKTEETKDPVLREYSELANVAAELVAKTFMKTGGVPDPLIMRKEIMIPDGTVATQVLSRASDIEFKKIDSLKVPMVDMAIGAYHSLLVGKDGKLWGFGRNEFLQLGMDEKAWKIPQNRIIEEPKEISLPPMPSVDGSSSSKIIPKVSKISAGQNHSVMNVVYVGQDDGKIKSSLVYAFGKGLLGQIGHGKYSHISPNPEMIKVLSNQTFYNEKTKKHCPITCQSVTCGPNHSIVVLSTSDSSQASCGNDVYVWGLNESYQLGIGKRINLCSPKSPKIVYSSTSNHHRPDYTTKVPYEDSIVKPFSQKSSSDNDESISSKIIDLLLGRVHNASSTLVEAASSYGASTEMNSTSVGTSFYAASSGERYSSYQVPLQVRKDHKIACGPDTTFIY